LLLFCSPKDSPFNSSLGPEPPFFTLAPPNPCVRRTPCSLLFPSPLFWCFIMSTSLRACLSRISRVRQLQPPTRGHLLRVYFSVPPFFFEPVSCWQTPKNRLLLRIIFLLVTCCRAFIVFSLFFSQYNRTPVAYFVYLLFCSYVFQVALLSFPWSKLLFVSNNPRSPPELSSCAFCDRSCVAKPLSFPSGFFPRGRSVQWIPLLLFLYNEACEVFLVFSELKQGPFGPVNPQGGCGSGFI